MTNYFVVTWSLCWLLLILFTLSVDAGEASDTELIAAVLVLEAGGDGEAGMQAVREVIANRARERHQTEAQVVTARKQFSCMNGKTAREAVAIAQKHPKAALALKIAAQTPGNVTKGANHYHAKGIMPAWAIDRKPMATIGNHMFYRL